MEKAAGQAAENGCLPRYSSCVPQKWTGPNTSSNIRGRAFPDRRVSGRHRDAMAPPGSMIDTASAGATRSRSIPCGMPGDGRQNAVMVLEPEHPQRLRGDRGRKTEEEGFRPVDHVLVGPGDDRAILVREVPGNGGVPWATSHRRLGNRPLLGQPRNQESRQVPRSDEADTRGVRLCPARPMKHLPTLRLSIPGAPPRNLKDDPPPPFPYIGISIFSTKKFYSSRSTHGQFWSRL